VVESGRRRRVAKQLREFIESRNLDGAGPENCSSMLWMAAAGRMPRYGATIRSR
jgi:hypothetical protein